MAHGTPLIQWEDIPTTRVEALTDGIFAIAMTLLVLDVHIPELVGGESLSMGIVQSFPSLVSFFMSFIILGVYWVGHHNFFHLIKRVDRNMLWLNILFLVLISLIPFSAVLLRTYGEDPVAMAWYGIHLALIGAVLWIGWTYATRHHHLVDEKMSHSFMSAVSKYIAVAPLAYVVAIFLAFINPKISLLLFFLVPIYYIIPSPVARNFPGRREHKHGNDDHAHEDH